MSSSTDKLKPETADKEQNLRTDAGNSEVQDYICWLERDKRHERRHTCRKGKKYHNCIVDIIISNRCDQPFVSSSHKDTLLHSPFDRRYL